MSWDSSRDASVWEHCIIDDWTESKTAQICCSGNALK